MFNNQTNAKAPNVAESVIRQAIAWHIRLESAPAESEIIACQHWRQSDPSHELAWERLQQLDSTLQQAANSGGSLAHSTLLKTSEDCHNIGRRQALKTMAGSAFSICAVGLLAYEQGVIDRLRADYSTANNQRNRYTLPDSSQLWLNSGSAVRLDFNKNQRVLELTRGEINLSAAFDPRPLKIEVPHGTLSATDDQFLVRSAGDHTLLQVVSGHVLIIPKQSVVGIEAQAGQVYQISDRGVRPLNSQMFDYSSWIDGVFSVRNMPLKQLLAELSHYHPGYVRCDASLDNCLISGVYQLDDTDLILQVLARSNKAKVRYITRWWAEITPHDMA